MAELSILEQTVLTGIIEKFTAPPENVGQSIFARSSYPYTSAKWDVVQGSRKRAHFTLPNREGKVVEQLGVGQKTANFLYVREKKAFEPTTLRWLRTPGELAQANAEAAIRRELEDLNNRVERLVESTCWDALKGTITINEPDIKATVDLGIPVAHKPTAAVSWDHVTGTAYDAPIIDNLKAWKKLVVEACGFPLTDIYLSSSLMKYVELNADVRYHFTDRYKEQYLSTGFITGLLGLNWHIFDGGYVNDSDVFVPYIDDEHCILVAKNSGSFQLLEGLSADLDSPEGHTGKFSKSWTKEDPSAHFILVEYSFIPILKDATSLVYADCISA